MLSILSRKYQLIVNVIVFHGNAERINAFWKSQAPNKRIRMNRSGSEFRVRRVQIKACIERGEFVAMWPIARRRAGRCATRTHVSGRSRALSIGQF